MSEQRIAILVTRAEVELILGCIRDAYGAGHEHFMAPGGDPDADAHTLYQRIYRYTQDAAREQRAAVIDFDAELDELTPAERAEVERVMGLPASEFMAEMDASFRSIKQRLGALLKPEAG